MVSEIERTLKRLGHWEPAVRARAAEELAEQPDTRAVVPLIGRLEDADTFVRRAAAVALGKLGDSRALEPLVRALQQDPDKVVRRRAATALGELGDERARGALLQAVKDVPKSLAETASGVPGYAALALDRLGETWSPSLEARLNEPDAWARERIILSLAPFTFKGERPFGIFVAALKDASAKARYPAIWALAHTSSNRAVEPLIEALRDERGQCRRLAAQGLERLKAKEAVEPLIAALFDSRDDEYGWNRGAVADALASIGDERAIGPLAALVEDDSSPMRWSASWALGGMGTAGFRALYRLLAHPDSQVRWRAVAALKRHGAAAFEPIASALSDSDAEVRSAAIEALADIDARKAVDAIIPMLGDEDANVRWDAAQTLGEIGDDRAVPALTRVRDTDTGERTGKAYRQSVSEVAADALFRIRRRKNPNLVRIDGVEYELVNGQYVRVENAGGDPGAGGQA